MKGREDLSDTTISSLLARILESERRYFRNQVRMQRTLTRLLEPEEERPRDCSQQGQETLHAIVSSPSAARAPGQTTFFLSEQESANPSPSHRDQPRSSAQAWLELGTTRLINSLQACEDTEILNNRKSLIQKMEKRGRDQESVPQPMLGGPLGRAAKTAASLSFEDSMQWPTPGWGDKASTSKKDSRAPSSFGSTGQKRGESRASGSSDPWTGPSEIHQEPSISPVFCSAAPAREDADGSLVEDSVAGIEEEKENPAYAAAKSTSAYQSQEDKTPGQEDKQYNLRLEEKAGELAKEIERIKAVRQDALAKRTLRANLLTHNSRGYHRYELLLYRELKAKPLEGRRILDETLAKEDLDDEDKSSPWVITATKIQLALDNVQAAIDTAKEISALLMSYAKSCLEVESDQGKLNIEEQFTQGLKVTEKKFVILKEQVSMAESFMEEEKAQSIFKGDRCMQRIREYQEAQRLAPIYEEEKKQRIKHIEEQMERARVLELELEELRTREKEEKRLADEKQNKTQGADSSIIQFNTTSVNPPHLESRRPETRPIRSCQPSSSWETRPVQSSQPASQEQQAMQHQARTQQMARPWQTRRANLQRGTGRWNRNSQWQAAQWQAAQWQYSQWYAAQYQAVQWKPVEQQPKEQSIQWQ